MSQMTVCKYSNLGGFFGEISIEDIRVFPESDSPLFDVEQMWQATKKYTILINDALDEAVSATSAADTQHADPEMEAMRMEEHDQFRRTQDILLHASIFTMQCAFMEYALKRVYAVAIKTPAVQVICL